MALPDGNGRIARLRYTVILSKWNAVFDYIPIESLIEKCQDGYYKTMAECHVNGNLNVFTEVMLEQIACILEKVIIQIPRYDDTLSGYVK